MQLLDETSFCSAGLHDGSPKVDVKIRVGTASSKRVYIDSDPFSKDIPSLDPIHILHFNATMITCILLSLWIAAAVAFPQTSETLPPIVTLTTSTTTSTTIFPRLSSSVTQVVQPSSSVTQVQASQSTSLSIPFEHSLPCLTQPIGNVVAGSNITYGYVPRSR